MTKTSQNTLINKTLGLIRISLGFIFLWAFIDKLVGLGFATCRSTTTNVIDVGCSAAWFQGGSPTTGFLKFGTSGPFADFYQSLAGSGFIDWLFMIGLLGIGIGLILGVAMRLSVISGILMMLMMYSATLWPVNNPIIDDHIIYALLLVTLQVANTHQAFGFGKQWAALPLIKKYPILR